MPRYGFSLAKRRAMRAAYHRKPGLKSTLRFPKIKNAIGARGRGLYELDTGVYQRGAADFVNRSPFPCRRSADLVYTETWDTVSCGIAGTLAGEKIFNINSLFGPQPGGHQPYYRDQLAAIYGRYKVHRVSIKVRIHAPSTNQVYLVWTLQNSHDATTLTGSTGTVVAERPWSGMICMSPTGEQHKEQIINCNIAQLEGLTPQQFYADDTNYSAPAGNGPNFLPQFHLAVGDIGGNNTNSVSVCITIQFHCSWYGLQSVAAS